MEKMKKNINGKYPENIYHSNYFTFYQLQEIQFVQGLFWALELEKGMKRKEQ